MDSEYYNYYVSQVENLIESADMHLKKEVERVCEEWYRHHMPTLAYNISYNLYMMLKEHPSTKHLGEARIEEKRIEAMTFIHNYIKEHLDVLSSSFYPDPAVPDIHFMPPYIINRAQTIREEVNLDNLAEDLADHFTLNN